MTRRNSRREAAFAAMNQPRICRSSITPAFRPHMLPIFVGKPLLRLAIALVLLLPMQRASAKNEVLYSYSHVFCATTYDTVNLAITITVDASTPDGIYQIRYNRISQAGPDSYDPFCNFWVSNGIITAAEWSGTGIGTSSFTFGGGIASGTSGGGLRYYDYANYAHKVEWPVSEGGTIDVGPCPAPDGIVYTGAMTLDFRGGGQ